MEKLNKTQIDELVAMEKNLGEKLISELVKIYNEQLNEVCAEIPTILQSSDFSRLSQLSHKLKSSAGNLGLIEPAKICLELEIQAKNRASVDYLQEVDHLQKASADSIAALLKYAA